MSLVIPTYTAYSLVEDNLAKAEMLLIIYLYNLSDWAQQLDMVLGMRDKEQWHVSSRVTEE